MGGKLDQTTATRTRLLQGIGLAVAITAAIGGGVFYAVTRTKITQKTAPPPTLEQLTSDLAATIQEYWQTPPSERQAKVPDLIELAKKRKPELVALITPDPQRFLDLALPQGQTLSLPPELQQHLELPVMREGRLEVRHTDYFQTGKSIDAYTVIAEDGTRRQLVFAGPIPSLKEGLMLRVTGVEIDSTLVADSDIAANVESSAPASPLVSGAKKVAVFVYSLPDNPLAPDPNIYRGVVFTDQHSINAYYQETSFGNLSLVGKLSPQGDVYGPYTVTGSAAACDLLGWGEQARQQALEAGADLTGYDYYVYMGSEASCGGVGGFASGDVAHINGVIHPFIAHELGHLLGTDHAGVLGSSEYADPFDVMGNRCCFTMRHMSTGRKAYLGWYQGGDLPEVTTTGTYTIYPLEEPSASPKGLKINAGVSGGVVNFFYLEYRRPFPHFDNFLPTDPVVNGISIRKAGDTGGLGRTWLIDTTPGDGNFYNAALQVGTTFTDTPSGVQVTTTQVAPDFSSAETSITLTCAHFNPTVTASSSIGWVAGPGEDELYRLTITNNDSMPCGPSTFEVAATNLQAGWSQAPAPATVTIPAGQSASVDITVTSPPTATGIAFITERASNQSIPSLQGSTTIQYRIDTVVPTVTITNPANGALLDFSSTVIITATTVDNYFVAEREIFIDETSVVRCGQAVPNCTYDWRLTGVSAGTHSIRYTGADLAGNVGAQTITVKVVIGGSGKQELMAP